MLTGALGDMAQQFTSLRNGGAIKSDLARLADSLSSGTVADVTAHLGGETARFAGIKYSLQRLDAYNQIGIETQQTLTAMQTALGQVDRLRSDTANDLLRMGDATTNLQVDRNADAARSAFASIIQTLNTQVADRALFSGAAVDQPPLATADDILTDLTTAIGGAVDAPTISAAVTAWFSDAVGGYAATGYLGDTGAAPERSVSDTKVIATDARADDPAIMAVLQASALGALADALPGIDTETKAALLTEAGQDLFAAADGLVGVRARVGVAEEEIATVLAENAAQQTTYQIAQNDLVAADPFETATRLQAVQLQLETHYAVTARMSQLSLLRYI